MEPSCLSYVHVFRVGPKAGPDLRSFIVNRQTNAITVDDEIPIVQCDSCIPFTVVYRWDHTLATLWQQQISIAMGELESAWPAVRFLFFSLYSLVLTRQKISRETFEDT